MRFIPAPTPAPPAPPFASVPASLCALAHSGLRKILVTRTLEDDGDPAFRAAILSPEPGPGPPLRPGGFVGEAAMALASQGHRVLIVQTGPRLGAPGLPVRRGLWELLHGAYLCDLAHERTRHFGLGDWLEILDAQGRTGELLVSEGEDLLRVRLVQGSIRAIACPGSADDERRSERELLARVSAGIGQALRAARPTFRFIESADMSGARGEGARGGIDKLFRERLHERMPHPFLAERIAAHQSDTALPQLKRITAGAGGVLTRAFRRPLELLLERLSLSFDVVLIDAPPVSIAGPTGMLAGLADGALVVASPTGIRSGGLIRALDVLRRHGAMMIAVHAVRPAVPPAPPSDF